VKANETTLDQLLGAPVQYQVPLYQRTYSCGEKQLSQLWTDLITVADQFVDGRSVSTHFLGSMVLAPSPSISPAKVREWLIVDGQQRLTTLTVLFAALRDRLVGADPLAIDKFNQFYLLNPWSTESERFKVLPTQLDLFDVVAIYLPDAWVPAFRAGDFDLHDGIKAGAASLGIPTQLLDGDLWTYPCRASVAWRLSIALYSKFGGNPWKIAYTSHMRDTAYIGPAYARRGKPKEGDYVTCCSQVFDADGGGMQFVAFDVGDGVDLRNPFLRQEQMCSVMARSIALYQRRNGGLLTRRVVIHKTNYFTDQELAGAREALLGVEEVDCVQMQTRVAWRAVKINSPRDPVKPDPRSLPVGYPDQRGTVVYLSGRSVLLWIGGNTPDLVSGRSYFQGGNSMPGPLLLARFAGRGDLEGMALEVLALTKMDWNNDALFDPLPVTSKYSQALAKVISYTSALGSQAYPYRLFI